MADQLGIQHLVELSGTEAILGYLCPSSASLPGAKEPTKALRPKVRPRSLGKIQSPSALPNHPRHLTEPRILSLDDP